MASLAVAKPVPGYKPGSDPLAEAKWVLHRNIKNHFEHEKWYEALKNSNVKFIQAEEAAFVGKGHSAQTSAWGKPQEVTIKTQVVVPVTKGPEIVPVPKGPAVVPVLKAPAVAPTVKPAANTLKPSSG